MRSNSEVASRENAKFNRPKPKFSVSRIKVATRVSNKEKKKPKMQSCDIHHNVGSRRRTEVKSEGQGRSATGEVKDRDDRRRATTTTIGD
ncbi:hypothetical protein Q3G72_026636 [Acer saccharum]|nr:hypothetical protein Q3G72_026636 [Acer saccharum]